MKRYFKLLSFESRFLFICLSLWILIMIFEVAKYNVDTHSFKDAFNNCHLTSKETSLNGYSIKRINWENKPSWYKKDVIEDCEALSYDGRSYTNDVIYFFALENLQSTVGIQFSFLLTIGLLPFAWKFLINRIADIANAIRGKKK